MSQDLQVPRPVYIVSGYPRSGTSMMMRCLDLGGIPCLYKHRPGEEKLAKYGTYEIGRGEFSRKGFFQEARGHAVKIMLEQLPVLPLNVDIRIVIMVRDPSAIHQSAEAAFGRAPGFLRKRAQYFARIQTAERNLQAQANVRVVLVGYERVLEAPRETLRYLQFHGFPIDIDTAKTGVEKHLKKF